MSWKEPQKWQVMKSGEDCPMCKDISLQENPFSLLIEEFSESYFRLPKNQYWRGWGLVALKRHANELYEMTDQELSGFFQEVAKAAKAIQTVFSPVKMNYAVFGNLCPHVHCHILPQYEENDPHAPIKLDDEKSFSPKMNTWILS